MKTFFLLTIVASFFVCSSNAQIKKGTIFLGGDVGASGQATKINDATVSKQSSIIISPVLGKAIRDNLVVGLSGLIGFSKQRTTDNASKYKTRYYGGGAFVRKYKNLGGSSFYLFGEAAAQLSYYWQKQEGPVVVDETKRISGTLSAHPGLAYAVSNRLHLETGFLNIVSLSYFREKRDVGDPINDYRYSGWSFSSSLNNATSSIYIGIRFLLAP